MYKSINFHLSFDFQHDSKLVGKLHFFYKMLSLSLSLALSLSLSKLCWEELPKMEEDFFIMVCVLNKSVVVFDGGDEALAFSLYVPDDHSHCGCKAGIGSLHLPDGKLHLHTEEKHC